MFERGNAYIDKGCAKETYKVLRLVLSFIL